MKFNRKAPGGGLEIVTTLQNGKANFQCIFHLKPEQEDKDSSLELRIWNRQNQLVFQAHRKGVLEEPLKGMILHPHLWQAGEDAYLYRVQVILKKDHDTISDLLENNFAFCNLCEIPMKGWFLNEKPIEIRAVEYELPKGQDEFENEEKNAYDIQLRRDLQFIRDMGANGIFPGGKEFPENLYNICRELGLIVWKNRGNSMPQFQELMKNGSFTDCYYYYKACWSKEPFVYISRESLGFETEETLRVTVYSNQPKVALYVEGDLFEFRKEGPDFVFEGIPAKQLPVLLTAETGGCSMSLSETPVHKKNTK